MGVAEVLLIGVGLVMIVFAGIASLAMLAVATAKRRMAPTVTMVRMRAATLPGRRGRDIALLRLQLRDSLQYTAHVLASAEPSIQRIFADLWNELATDARALDRHLLLLEPEPTPSVRAGHLDGLVQRTDRLCEDLAKLREVVYGLAIEFHESTHRALEADRTGRLDGLLSAVNELRGQRV